MLYVRKCHNVCTDGEDSESVGEMLLKKMTRQKTYYKVCSTFYSLLDPADHNIIDYTDAQKKKSK